MALDGSKALNDLYLPGFDKITNPNYIWLDSVF